MKTVRLYGALRREFGREYVLDVSGRERPPLPWPAW